MPYNFSADYCQCKCHQNPVNAETLFCSCCLRCKGCRKRIKNSRTLFHSEHCGLNLLGDQEIHVYS